MNYAMLDFIGLIGVVVIVATYLLLQLNKLGNNDLSYSLLNAIGASLIALTLLVNFNLPALLMEVFWVLISCLGIYRYFRFKTVGSENH